MSQKYITLISVAIAVASLALLASQQHNTYDHQSHQMNPTSAERPSESGQDTFAALIEVVALLEQRADTNWNDVTITTLHTHLLDMDYLMTETTVVSQKLSGRDLVFEIQGNDKSVPAIHRMVPAHASVIESTRNWSTNTTLSDTGVTLTITVEDPSVLTKLTALGFYGFMALDSHHQAHHLHMATGGSH